MSGFRLEPKQYNLFFEDPKFDGLEVQLTGMSMQQVMDFDLQRFGTLTDPEKVVTRSAGTAEMLARHLVGWNLTEADGSPTPLTAAGLLSHDQEVLQAITTAYVQALRGVSAPLGSGSTSGEGVESLPTETLPTSP